MSRLDFCQYELVDDCYDWKNDNCDECNIFKAYCEGARRAKNSIVRCKDCDNTVPHWYMLNGKKVDCNWCVEMESEVDDDEYCSRAVPKGTREKMKGGNE